MREAPRGQGREERKDEVRGFDTCSSYTLVTEIYSSSVQRGRDGMGREGTGRDGKGRDGTGRDGTGREGT